VIHALVSLSLKAYGDDRRMGITMTAPELLGPLVTYALSGKPLLSLSLPLSLNASGECQDATGE
jgi:hypothetical protein